MAEIIPLLNVFNDTKLNQAVLTLNKLHTYSFSDLREQPALRLAAAQLIKEVHNALESRGETD